MSRKTLILATLVVALACPTAAFATVFRVDASSTATTPDGSAWDNTHCFQYLQDALEAAAADTNPANLPHTLRLAQGVYHPDDDLGTEQTPGDRDAAFAMLANVTIQGGYRGLAGLPSNADNRNIATYVTILSGDLTDNDTWPNANGLDQAARETNSKHVVLAWSVSDSAVLDGLVVSDAESFDDDDTDGGGISVINSPAQFTNCTIRRCRVGIDRLGGGMFVNSGANPTVTGCLMEDSEAGTGGGVSVRQSLGLFEASIIQNCVATGFGGGGMSVSFSPNDESGFLATRVNNTQFLGNHHTPNAATLQLIEGGGGVLVYDRPAAVFRDCTLSGNIAEDTPGGGAMEDGSAHVCALINCIFDANQSTYSSGTGGRGGGLYTANTSDTVVVKIISCQFSNNLCGGAGDSTPLHGGAGLYCDRAKGYIVNSLFRDNSGRNGAGMLCKGSMFSVENCTLSQNTASNLGGGIYASKFTGTTVGVALPTVTNTIIWGNTSTNGTSEQKQFWTDRISTNPVVLTYSCLQNKATSGVLDHATNTASDPLFRNPTVNDFHLTRCSPVIDRGNTTATEQDELNIDLDTDTTCSGSGSACHPGERTPTAT